MLQGTWGGGTQEMPRADHKVLEAERAEHGGHDSTQSRGPPRQQEQRPSCRHHCHVPNCDRWLLPGSGIHMYEYPCTLARALGAGNTDVSLPGCTGFLLGAQCRTSSLNPRQDSRPHGHTQTQQHKGLQAQGCNQRLPHPGSFMTGLSTKWSSFKVTGRERRITCY